MLRIASTAAVLSVIGVAHASFISYEGDVFPENAGWVRDGTFDADRFLEDGWFVQEVDLGVWDPPPGGEQDRYLHALSVPLGVPVFVEWRVITDAPRTEINGVGGASLVVDAGPVLYHFTIAADQVRLLRDVQFEPVWVDIEPSVPHTYRLELDGAVGFRWYVEERLIASGVPEDDLGAYDATINFRAKHYLSANRTEWDYVHVGTIPEPATGLLVLFGAAVLRCRRFHAR